MTLHCLTSDPQSSAATRLRRQLREGEPVLLTGSAAVLAWKDHPCLPAWLDSGGELYVLEADFLASGLAPCHPAITLIDFAGWVSLSEREPNQQTWY